MVVSGSNGTAGCSHPSTGTNTCSCGIDTSRRSHAAVQIKYCTKDSHALQNTLSILAAARKHNLEYRSRAADADTDTRTTIYLLQRTLNGLTGSMEMAATQSAALVLGHPAEMTSIEFWNVYVSAAVAFAKSVDEGATIDASPLEGSDAEDEDALADALQLEEEQELDAEVAVRTHSNGESGAAAVFTTTGANGRRNTVVVAQHTHYRYRGWCLAAYNLYEYAALIDVIPRPAVAAATGAARPRNGTFPFHPSHPLASTHVQRIRSKHRIPTPIGPPPPPPGQRQHGAEAGSWHRKGSKFAAYMLTLFRPWDVSTCKPNGPMTMHAFCEFMEQLEWGTIVRPRGVHRVANASAAAPVLPQPTILGRMRTAVISNMAAGLRCTDSDKKEASVWRTRFTKYWGIEVPDGTERPPTDHGPVLEGEEEETRRQETSAEMQHLHDLQSMQSSDRELRTDAFITNSLATLAALHGATTQPPAAGIATHSPLHIPAEEAAPLRDVSKALRRPAIYRPPPPRAAGEGRRFQHDAHGVQLHMNAEQALVNAAVNDYFTALVAHRNDGSQPLPPPLRLLVNGGPGVGKTFLIGEIRETAAQHGFEVISAAYTGVAASGMANGETLHGTFHIPCIESKQRYRSRRPPGVSSGMPLPPMSNAQRANLQARLTAAGVIVIDEVS